MMTRKFAFLAILACFALTASAQDDESPTINPIATFTDSEGKEEESTDFSGSAPIIGRFQANPENVGSWNEYYEWRFTLEGEEQGEPYLIRYEQDTDYTFTQAGSHKIVCYATFTQGNDTIAYTQEYWNDLGPIRVTVSESKLDMPNAFSPNGDDINDTYKPKEGWKSLVEFRAIIFSRWGQKLYEWTDPASKGWDGTFNGHPVKEGVYYVDVTAKGADGRKYHIRKDVNLLRGFREHGTSTPSGGTE